MIRNYKTLFEHIYKTFIATEGLMELHLSKTGTPKAGYSYAISYDGKFWYSVTKKFAKKLSRRYGIVIVCLNMPKQRIRNG